MRSPAVVTAFLLVATIGLLPAPVAAQGPLTWSPCPAQTPGDREPPTECAQLVRPLHEGRGESATIAIALRRLRGAEGDAPTRLWYVAGGPGDAATTALLRLREVFPDPTIDLYAVDHRGTGGSARLGCPAQEAAESDEGSEISRAEWPACIDWLQANRDDLDGLTASASAGDLAAAIDALAGVAGNDIVFGASYGTALVNRYLLLRPEQPDAIILDGLVPADWTIDELDRSLADFGERLLARCADNPGCAAHLGSDPVALTRAVADRFDAGHCPDLQVDGDTIRLLLGNLAMGGPHVWPYLPPLVYRLDQCRLRDMLAIGALVENLFESGEIAEDPKEHAPVLQRHVALSEMWPVPPPDIDSLVEIAAAASMTTAIGPSFATTFAAWPRYPRPAAAGVQTSYAGPALLLHGGLDPTMPLARLGGMLAGFDRPGQTFVIFPDAGHVTLNENPCARSIYAEFIANPGRAPAIDCVADAASEPLAPAPDADSPFDTDDLWGESLSTLELQAIFFATAALAILAGTIWFFVRRRRGRRAAGR